MFPSSRPSFFLLLVLGLIALKLFSYLVMSGKSRTLSEMFDLHWNPLYKISRQLNGWSASEWRLVYEKDPKARFDRYHSWINSSSIGFINAQDVECSSNRSAVLELSTVLVLVVSAPNNTLHRAVIRDTWGKEIVRLGARTLFLIGRSPSQTVNNRVSQESDDNGDVVRVDFLDSYYNLTVKSVVLLEWAVNFCPSFHHVIKIDDDVYLNTVNVARILGFIKGNSISGNAALRSTVQRDPGSKWFVPESVYPWKYYPDYLTGYMYVMTMEAAYRLLKAAPSVPYFIMEDIYVTGMLSSLAESQLLGNPSLPTFATPVGSCDLLASPEHTPEEIRRKFLHSQLGLTKC